MSRTIEVNGEKKFRIQIPDEAELTFGPWSPPAKEDDGTRFASKEARRGTLRVYSAKKKEILAVFAGVTSFRDLNAISYSEEVVRLEGEALWKDDEHGYVRKASQKAEKAWVGELGDGNAE